MKQRLTGFYDQFRSSVSTKTRNTSEYGLCYLSGLLRMETKRTMTNIGRKTDVSKQNMQHFMSNSPWSGRVLIRDIQDAIKVHTEFQSGAILVLDESAEEKAGEHSAGAGRQHNGRLGKVEMSQVGVFLSLVTPRVNTWIDGELYLQKHWFTEEYTKQRKKAGIPETRTFRTKPEWGWQMIERAQANGILVLDGTWHHGFVSLCWLNPQNRESVEACTPGFREGPVEVDEGHIHVPAKPRTWAEAYEGKPFGYNYRGGGS